MNVHWDVAHTNRFVTTEHHETMTYKVGGGGWGILDTILVCAIFLYLQMTVCDLYQWTGLMYNQEDSLHKH